MKSKLMDESDFAASKFRLRIYEYVRRGLCRQLLKEPEAEPKQLLLQFIEVKSLLYNIMTASSRRHLTKTAY